MCRIPRIFSVRAARPTAVSSPRLSADSTKMMLYDVDKKSWAQLAESRFGFENWSHDGKYLFAEDYSDKTDDLARVTVANGKVERLFSLKEVPRGFDPWEFWIGLGARRLVPADAG